jgi:hypothetical protein
VVHPSLRACEEAGRSEPNETDTRADQRKRVGKMLFEQKRGPLDHGERV